MGKSVCPDPLAISPVDPLDYRMVEGKWVYEPGWWKAIASRQPVAVNENSKQERRRYHGNKRARKKRPGRAR